MGRDSDSDAGSRASADTDSSDIDGAIDIGSRSGFGNGAEHGPDFGNGTGGSNGDIDAGNGAVGSDDDRDVGNGAIESDSGSNVFVLASSGPSDRIVDSAR